MERGVYKISEEFVIDRSITIQGDALMLPSIDCKESVRAFRIKVCSQLLLVHGIPRPSSRPPPRSQKMAPHDASHCLSLIHTIYTQ